MKVKRTGSSFQAMNTTRKLESIFLFVTGRCNSKCAMCFYADDMAKRERDLTLDEMRKISETAGEINRLWISGGEPTLRDDLPEILEMFYKNNHIKDVNMPTNALRADRLIEWVGRFRRNCPDCNINVSISLDGFGEVHDRQRGVPGNFYIALAALKRVCDTFKDDAKVITNIATVITKFNIDQVNDFMEWMLGRFNLTNHTIEAARGVTREDGVKVLDEKGLRAIQDKAAPIYSAYAERIAANTTGLRRPLARFFYKGFIRTMYNVRAKNIDHPTPWGYDCTAGETTLVIDYDGRFRACELREPLGKLQDYDFDIQRVMHSDVMKQEIAAIGHGFKANCWCTHSCWISSCLAFSPRKMLVNIWKGNREVNKLGPATQVSESRLVELENKYALDRDKLKQIGLINA